MIVRDCLCLRCKARWVAKVEYSANTTNLSGEKTNWCPSCGTKEVRSSPHRPMKWFYINEVVASSVRNALLNLATSQRGVEAEKYADEVVHALDSGLHAAGEGELVPADCMLDDGK
jgi:hypothetical protein